MPGITNPAEEYFKDGLWGWASTLWEKLVSSGGRLFTALHGWDGGAWRKLPMVWGYSGVYAEDKYVIDTPAGNQTLTFGTVPVGEVWVVQGWTAWSKQANVVRLGFYVLSGAGSNRITVVPLASAYETKSANVPIILSGDDKLSVVFNACSLNDDIYSVAWGYKMKIAE